MADDYTKWLREDYKTRETKRDLNYYIAFLEGARLHLPTLVNAFGKDEIEPYWEEIYKFCNEKLDQYEKYEDKEKDYYYNDFLKKLDHSLDLWQLACTEPAVNWHWKGLIARTHLRRLEKRLCKKDMLRHAQFFYGNEFVELIESVD